MNPFASLLRGIVWLYQKLVSPLLPRSCRYEPTCSHYMRDAIRTHGAVHGTWLGVKRIGRCHPWGSGGFDPVPDAHPDRRVA